MAAFEPILSGIPGLDRCLDSIRLGDNVVWQVSDLDEFRFFAKAFAEQAVRDGRNILYIRFAGHDPILPAMPGVREVHVPLSHLFESFTVDIHNLIEREGRDAFYVFDCLSELEEAWATDLMMGNFFHLTCPFLFSLDTVAYFPVLRGRHSFDAIDIIASTTQLFLDIFPGGKGLGKTACPSCTALRLRSHRRQLLSRLGERGAQPLLPQSQRHEGPQKQPEHGQLGAIFSCRPCKI